MPRTIKIDGQVHRYDGLTEDRKGIKCDAHTFWMFPAVRHGGYPMEPLPPIGPLEIRCVTTEIPDLTAEHLDVVKEIYEKRLACHEHLTYENYIKNCPNDSWINAEQFEEARKRIMAETHEEFASTSASLKETIWERFGTTEQAEQIGFIEPWIQGFMPFWFKKMGISEDDALRAVQRLKWVAIYGDPDKTRIYLYDLIAEPDAKAAELELKRREVEVLEKSEVANTTSGQQGRDTSEIARAVTELASSQKRIEENVIFQGKSLEEIQTKLTLNQGVPSQIKEEKKPDFSCRMTFAGNRRWRIKFGSHEEFFASDCGIARELIFVFTHPHQEFHVMEVHSTLAMPNASIGVQSAKNAIEAGLSPQSGTHLDRPDKLTEKQYTQEKEDLEGELAAARESGDTLCAVDVEDKLARLEEYQQKALHPEKDPSKLCSDRFRIALKRFKDAIAKDRTAGGAAFLEHIDRHLTLAKYKFHYHPPEGFIWTD